MSALLAQPLEIGVAELARWREEGVRHVVLDVREPWETAICLIEGSLAVPLGQVPSAVSRLPTDMPVVVTCHHGMRSLRAVSWLRGNGFANAVNLAGGIDAWAREVDAAMNTY